MQIAAFTSHKNPQAPLANDDRIVAYAGRVFAVIDGVTAKKGPPLAGGESRGQAAGRLIEHALRELVDDGKAMTATTAQVLERIDHHFTAEYARLDMLEDARDPHLRFGAQLAAAFHDGASWRLFVVGDCGVRLNGVDVIATPNPGDGVLSLLRASVFTGALEHLAGEGTEVTDRALAVARAYTVAGSRMFLQEHADALPHHAYLESVATAESRALAEHPALPLDLVRDTLANGLLGIGRHRNTSGPLGAPCIDGTAVPASHVHDRRLDSDSVTTIELFSDGYFGTPPADHVTLADWEAHIAHVEATDPFKVGPYPSTKGSSSRSFTDDRTVLLITPTPVHPREEA